MQDRLVNEHRSLTAPGTVIAGAHLTTQTKSVDGKRLVFPRAVSCSAIGSVSQQTTPAWGTTTWHERNRANFLALATAAEELNLLSPVVINIGPGGMSPLTSGLFEFAAKISNRLVRTFWIKALKSIDTVIRNCFKSPNLVTAEPFEVLAALQRLKPTLIFVIDRNPAVLKAFQAGSTRKGIETPGISLSLDLEYQGITVQGDIVIAQGVLNRRTIQRCELVSNICRSVRRGGLLCMNIDHCPEGFAPYGRFWRKL